MSPAAALAFLWCAVASAAPASHRFYISPQETRALSPRRLAENVVERVRRECDLAGPQGQGEPVAAGADIILMTPRQVLASIVERGFLSWHQTGKTRGFHGDRFGYEQELAMARLPYDQAGRRLLPKYALLDLKRSDVGHFPLPTRYGDVAFVMKKEVQARATWTYADSLDFEFQAGQFSQGGAANPVLPHSFSYRRKPQDENRCVNYCEAQLWGDVDLGDVAYAMIPEGTPLPEALKTAGVDVYAYSTPRDGTTVVAPGQAAQYRRGRLLLKGAGPRRRVVHDLDEPPELPADETRALALLARSDEPWTELKPALLSALADKSPAVVTEAVALASEHGGDADVAAALKAAGAAHRNDHRLAVEEWLSRLEKPGFCQ